MMTMTIIAQVKAGKQQEFLQAISSLYSNNEEREEGLKRRTLYREMVNANSFRLVVEWETQKDLERYLQAEKFRVLLGALGILCRESEIRYSEKKENALSLPKIPLLLPEKS